MTTTSISLLLIALAAVSFHLPLSAAVGAASTLAISHATGTVCGVLASNPHTIQCARGNETYSLSPTGPFLSVSGGRDFLCAVRSRGGAGADVTPLLCWTPNDNATFPPPPRRIYAGSPALGNLAVGEDHVAAVQNGTAVRWWRGGGRFQDSVFGAFRSLTSGNGFTCGIGNDTDRVRCWGSGGGGVGAEIETRFSNVSLLTIVAGDSQACGVATNGALVCGGRNDSGQLPGSSVPFEPSGLALGRSHVCAIRRANGTVICWGGGGAGAYSPIGNVSVELIVAGGDLTCGVMTLNFSVICWGLRGSSPSPVVLPLGPVLPGLCTNSCPCGEFPDSGNLCSGSGIICKPCGSDSSPPQSSPSGPPPSSPPEVTTRRTPSKGLLAFAIVGSVGSFAGLCAIVYCLWFGVCRQKKVHNSVQPTIASAAPTNGANRHGYGRSNSHSPPTAPPYITSSGSPAKPFKSRSMSSIFRRQPSRTMNRQRSGPSSAKYNTDRAEEFTFQELSAATKSFALEAKIGAGSFGTVYRGKLPDGREVAIKRREVGPRTKRAQEKESEFQSELAFLSRLHHKHLVGLVGYCEEGEERLLVYEYMTNGALYDHLHGAAGREHGAALNSSWRMRVKVLLDAARGIEYLHSYAVPPIIHRDIKSSNILLDGRWTARVSDFGLSMDGQGAEGVVQAKTAGTVGYMDPEYYGLRRLTPKSDVYGFGVVMLEVLTGRRAIFRDDGGGGLMNVVDYALGRIVEGEVGRLLDVRVAPPGPREAEAVELVAYTAAHCVSLEGRERPTMTDVVSNLEAALALCEEGSRGSGNGEDSSGTLSLASMD